MMGQGIQVKCKKCGRMASADGFILDTTYGMMICPNCVKDKRSSAKIVPKQSPALTEVKKVEKPVGWDKEDELLERAYQQKLANTIKVEKIDDENVRYKCTKCTYKFKYNIERKHPSSCPYCGTAVGKISF